MLPGLTGESRNETLIEMMAGIGACGIIGQLVWIVIPGDKVLYSTGWWIGVLAAIACSYHMWWVLDKALDTGEGAAVKQIALMSALRYFLLVLIMILVMVTGIGNPVVTVLGVLTLKFGAYLQPFMHFLRKKLFGYQDEIPRKEEET